MRFTYWQEVKDIATTHCEVTCSAFLCFPLSDKPLPTILKCPKLPVLQSQQDFCSIFSLGDLWVQWEENE